MNSRVYQKKEQYNLGNGTLNLNVYNGEVAYYFPLTKIGGGNYQINTALVYNSNYENNQFNKKLGFGNGWKLNFESFLFVSDEGYNKYIYVDENWNIHNFIKYSRDYEYYDESGTGLKLITGTPYNKIYDESNNVYTFDRTTGKLISVTSGINDEIEKEIIYDEKTRVISVYDKRKPNHTIDFTYNGNNNLSKISSSVKDVYYTLEYDDNRLVKIYQETNKVYREIQEFWYDNNLMIGIINNDTDKALELSYNQNKLSSIKETVVSVSLETKNSTNYIGESINLGDSNYMTSQALKEKSKSRIIGKDILRETSFIYYDGYTDITDDNNKTYRYYFDIDGKNISIFEKAEESNKYFTLVKPSGYEINVESYSNSCINNRWNKMIMKDNNEYNLSLSNKSLKLFINYLSNSNTDNNQYFKLSFWLNFSNGLDSDANVKLTYKLNNKPFEEQTLISKTLSDVWQLVQIPLILHENQSTLSDVNLTIIPDNPSPTDQDKIYISDARINIGTTQKICIDSIKYGDSKTVELKLGRKLRYNEGTITKEVTLSKDFYITEADIIASYKSIFKNNIKNNNQSQEPFDFYYNNKSKVMKIGLVRVVPDDASSDEINYRFAFGRYDESDSQVDTDTPNYHLRKINYMTMGEDVKAYVITEVQQKISKINERYIYDTYTLIGAKTDQKEQLDETKTVTNIISQNDDGSLNYTKYIKKTYNNNELIKELIVDESNEYDEYGNLLKTKISSNLTNEELIKEYIYDFETPSLRENVYEIIENGIITKLFYNSDSVIYEMRLFYNKEFIDGQVNNISNTLINVVNYSYDEYGDLIKLKFYDNKNKFAYENKISYNDKRNINLINDNNTSFGFVYNSLNKLCEIYQNKKLLQKDVIVKKTDKDIQTSTYYYGDKNYQKIDTISKDGYVDLTKMIKLINGVTFEEKYIRYLYEDLNNEYSSSLKRIKNVVDGISGNRYEYTYNDTPVNGTTITFKEGRNFTVITKPDQTKIYDIVSDLNKIKYKTEQVDKLNNNPKFTYNYNINETEEELNKYYSYDYEYDDLNRLIKQKQKEDEYVNATIYKSKEINYYENTNLPYEIKHKVKSVLEDTEKEAIITYQNSYVKGNIVKVVEEGTRFIYNPKNNNSLETKEINRKETRYEYDSFNRLTKEIKPNNDEYNYIYGSSGMIEEIRKNGVIVEQRKYNASKLTNILKNDKIINIEYDNYGNIIKLGNDKLEFGYLNLLNKYQNNNTYNFEYNCQGYRTKKIKENDYEVIYYRDSDKIIGEDVIDIKTKNVIRKFRYYYDAFGICGLNYIIDEADHYYNLVKDSIGNVSKIMYRGKVIGEYTYDAWGNCEEVEIVVDNQMDKDVIKYNPFRYKGYYLDIETNLYYCNARYYDPSLYMWLSRDSIECLDSTSVNGINLYCYCNNNPVMNIDPSGQFFIGLLFQIAVSVISYIAIAIVSLFDEEIKKDMDAIGWNISNTDEEAVINSSKVSFYKGVPVFRISEEARSFSLGVIFLAKDSNVNTLNHERGHNEQLIRMELLNYIIGIGIPSHFKFDGWLTINDEYEYVYNYYNAPWEITADMYGGVSRSTHDEQYITQGWDYLEKIIKNPFYCFKFKK